MYFSCCSEHPHRDAYMCQICNEVKCSGCEEPTGSLLCPACAKKVKRIEEPELGFFYSHSERAVGNSVLNPVFVAGGFATVRLLGGYKNKGEAVFELYNVEEDITTKIKFKYKSFKHLKAIINDLMRKGIIK